MANSEVDCELRSKHDVVPTENTTTRELTMAIEQGFEANMIVELPFIVSVNQAKADPETRLLIRSHVMIGKNRGRELKKQQGPRKKKTSKLKALKTSDLPRVGTIPRWLTSKFSSVRFADDVEPALLEDVLNRELSTCFLAQVIDLVLSYVSVLSIASKAMFLLDQCIVPSEDGIVRAWFTPLLSDAAWLHAACLATQAFFVSFYGRTQTLEARRGEYTSFSKTVTALQGRLVRNNRKELITDSTMLTIWALSGFVMLPQFLSPLIRRSYAYTQGDHQAAHQHNVALIKLAQMRGAHAIIQNQSRKLVIEIIRTEFCMCYENGQAPMLFTYDQIPWSLMGPSPGFFGEDTSSNLGKRLDPVLSAIFNTMRYFCGLVNIAARDEAARLTEDAFLHAMGSILYRLLYLRYERGSLDETIRLSLLALSAPIFLDWKTVYWVNGHFIASWRHCLTDLLTGLTCFAPQDSIWILMTGALSMSHDPDFRSQLLGGLQVLTASSHVTMWEDLEKLLQSYVWIRVLFDEPAKDIFDSIKTSSGKQVFSSPTICHALS